MRRYYRLTSFISRFIKVLILGDKRVGKSSVVRNITDSPLLKLLSREGPVMTPITFGGKKEGKKSGGGGKKSMLDFARKGKRRRRGREGEKERRDG